ncbi:MAG: hypothetical protein JXP73_19235 [Deltaproteobacteria bacterium]|nr:hypothetical protein [Deltaproteobacteria bacterium]
MKLRKPILGSLVLLACSRSPQDAGIVLNVDSDVTADRAVIDRVAVSVDGKRQVWVLLQPLPGSLGIKTSPGTKSVFVEGLANTVVRGVWSGSIVASKGSVVVKDVHLACAYCADAGSGATDGGGGTVGSLDGGRGSLDSGGGEAAGGDAGDAGRGGTSGQGGRTGSLDGGPGATTGTGGFAGATGGIAGQDASLGGAPAAGGVPGTGGALPGVGGSTGITAPFPGNFAVASQFQVPATVAAPGAVGDTLRLVHGFVEDPGAAILDFAEDAGVPALAALRAALPDALESQLTGWMNAYIKTVTVSGISPYDQLVWLDGTVTGLLLSWGLQSRLALPVGLAGTHVPLSLSFPSPSVPVVVPIEATAPVTSGTGVTAILSWPNGTDGPAVVRIADHSMGLPFGRYALQALNAILLAEYGAPNLAVYLSNAVGCPGMAAYVASRCVSIVCVGHEAELLDICEGGLAEGARQVEAQITSIDLRAIHFQLGTATAVGATLARPQDATALVDGVWTVTVDFGNGPEPATATFSAFAESGGS